MVKKRRKRGRRKGVTLGLRNEVWQDLFALLLFLVFVLVCISLYAPNLAGEASVFLNRHIVGATGVASHIIPPVLLLWVLAAMPLRTRMVFFSIGCKLAVVGAVFMLLAGAFARGGYAGTWADGLARPTLGIFYPILLVFILAALLIVFTGRAVLVPALRFIESASTDLSNGVRQRKEEEKLRREREKTEAAMAELEEMEEAEKESAVLEFDEEVPETRESAGAAAAKEPADEDEKETQRSLRFIKPDEEYEFPPLTLLNDTPFSPMAEDILKRNAQIIVETLKSFNIDTEVAEWEIGPRVTRFELKIGPGINVSRLHSLADNLALELAVPAVRLETPIPGKSAVGIEVPNRKFNKISLRSLLESPELKSQSHPLAVPFGRDIAGKPVIGNLHHMHHLLVAGSTGSGKSVCLNSILVSLMFRNSPATLRLILIDPKRVEMSVFKDTPHLATPIVHDINEAQSSLKWVVAEMESRLRAFEEEGVRNIEAYNANPPDTGPLPYILVVVDELADLVKAAGPVFERLIGRIAHLARATGIHLVVATQRPDTTVITGNIKMNIPSRIAFAVVSQIDSRTIIDMPGAEKLLGSGDMLYFPVGIPKPLRVQGVWVRDEEVRRVADFLRKQVSPQYIEEIAEYEAENGEDAEGMGEDEELDALYGDAMDIITRAGRASTSLLQRRLKIGYNRAARIMEQMEAQGVVSPADHQGNRELLIPTQQDEDF
jgi:S-DNA-T family DNA segregation ATPase FtsK/SpoIIIE